MTRIDDLKRPAPNQSLYHSSLLLPHPPWQSAVSVVALPCRPIMSTCVAILSPRASDWACLTSHFSVPRMASISSWGGRSNWISPVPFGFSRASNVKIWYSGSFRQSPLVSVKFLLWSGQEIYCRTGAYQLIKCVCAPFRQNTYKTAICWITDNSMIENESPVCHRNIYIK